MRKKIGSIVTWMIILIILGTGVWWLFNTGRLAYVNPGSQSSSVVCDTDIVDKYNAAMYFEPRNGSNKLSIDEEGIKSLAIEIKNKTDFRTDPTCQTILFWIAVHDDDYQSANKAYEEIKTLHSKHIFADSNIRSQEPLFTYEGYVNSLSGSGVKSEEGWSG